MTERDHYLKLYHIYRGGILIEYFLNLSTGEIVVETTAG